MANQTKQGEAVSNFQQALRDFNEALLRAHQSEVSMELAIERENGSGGKAFPVLRAVARVQL
jgi:hypothetical protein